MQIPSKSSDQFIKTMTEKSEKIRSVFVEKITNLTKSMPVKVMLGDSTVVDQTTFDPGILKQYYQEILKKLTDWKAQEISSVTDKDLRRLFIKFEIKEGNYLLSCHLSLQYHALLYYKPNIRVVEIQKELSEIIDKTKNVETQVSEQGDKIIQKKMKEIGQENIDQQKLFEIFFQNEDLTNTLIDNVYSRVDENFQNLSKRKLELFNELDSMLIEIYHTSPVMIDETRMIAAEEGCLCHFDLEYMKKDVKEGNFDPSKILSKVKENLLKRLDEVLVAL
ncbi:MAG TPA: hypothetical protein VLD38_08400 [Nitrosopumilaceae archaeon]|nr:hypothetical protein [Nitrosopumilaceae archaeon]